MPLNVNVKTEVIKNTEKFEGRVPHLYLDTRGLVTVGIGHLISNKAAMAFSPRNVAQLTDTSSPFKMARFFFSL